MLPENHGGSDVQSARILVRLATELGEQKYNNWFAQKVQVRIEPLELTLVCGNSYLASWLQKQFRTVALRLARELLGEEARVVWTYDEALVLTPAVVNSAETTAPPMAKSVARTSRDVPTSSDAASGLRTRTLSQFVVGDSNRLAFSAAQQFLAAQSHAPLYVYSPVGNGKSHLLAAIAAEIRRAHPKKLVLSLSAEAFANYYTQSIDAKSVTSFRQRFRNVDVFVVDDVDFLDGKRGLQEEFLQTLRRIESRGGQLVVAGDRHPNLLTRTSDEIISRLNSGWVCRLDAPDAATRMAILRQLMTTLEFELSDEVLQFVAARFKDNVRELEGAMNSLHNWTLAHQRKMSVTTAREALGRLERDCLRVVKMADVELAVCKMFGLTADDLRSNKRTKAATHPRMLAMYLARRLTGTAYAEIGQFFGGRNHSTVVSAERRVNEFLESRTQVRVGASEWAVQELVESLERQIMVG